MASASQPVDASVFNFNETPVFHSRAKKRSLLTDSTLSAPQSLPEYGLNLEDLPPIQPSQTPPATNADSLEKTSARQKPTSRFEKFKQIPAALKQRRPANQKADLVSANTGDEAKTIDGTEEQETVANCASASTIHGVKEEPAVSQSKDKAQTEPVEAIGDKKEGADSAPEPASKEQIAISVPALPSEASPQDAPLIIDNDEAVETKQTIKYEDLATDAGGTKVKAGAKFPVVISSQITSKSCKKGDPIEARLKYDLKIGDRLVAKKGSVVTGHINYALPARSALHSLVSPERWYRNSGCIGLQFDEIVNHNGEHIPLVAAPARQARIVKNKSEGRELGVNDSGQVTGPWSQQLRYKAVRIGLNAAMAPVGVFSFGAMPVALGVLGAANPSFAFMKPVGQNVRHRRIKGFVWGALSGVPGSWIVEDTVIKGQEAIIKPGDEFYAEFRQEFTGEPEAEATLIPGAKTKVHGEVLPDKKKP